jgi:hypothetical protein
VRPGRPPGRDTWRTQSSAVARRARYLAGGMPWPLVTSPVS